MIQELFPIKIYRNRVTSLANIEQQIIDFCEPMWRGENTSHPDLSPNMFTTFNQNNMLHRYELFAPLVEELNLMIAECWKEFQLYRNLTPIINEMWVNETKKDGAIISHNHAPYPIAGVVYLRHTPGMGNLVFENPINLLHSMQLYDWSGTTEITKNIEQEISVTTGDVVMFPGWLRHKTHANSLNESRYAMSFNVACTGEYPIEGYKRKI